MLLSSKGIVVKLCGKMVCLRRYAKVKKKKSKSLGIIIPSKKEKSWVVWVGDLLL